MTLPSLGDVIAGRAAAAPAAAPAPGPASTPAAPKRRAALNDQWPAAYAYDAASMYSQDMAGWLPWVRHPDGEINVDRDRMVARQRDLVRNDGWAAGAVERILDGAIGAEFRLIAEPDYHALSREDSRLDAVWAEEFGRAVESEWLMWSADPARWGDASRQQTLTQIFRTALRSKLIDGEAIAVLPWLPEYVGIGAARYATAVQLIDTDRLSNPYQLLDTHLMRGGVEIDDLGAAVAYHLRRAHQNEFFDTCESMVWDRVPRETGWGRPFVVHDFDKQRPGQHRGVSILAPVVSRFKMLNRYDTAELQAAVLQTIMSFYIESPFDQQDMEGALTADNDSDRLGYYTTQRAIYSQANPVMIGGVKVPKLFPGEKMGAVAATRPNSHFGEFEHTLLRNIASAFGTSAEQMSQDWSKTNYSSARAALLEAWKTMNRRRLDFAHGFCTPIYGAWLEEALDGRLRGVMPASAPVFPEWRAAYLGCSWIGPARGWVDPVKERQGAVLGLDAGFSTLKRECAEQGLDWRKAIDQRAIEVRRFKELGLKLPEWGGVEPAEQTAARPQPA